VGSMVLLGRRRGDGWWYRLDEWKGAGEVGGQYMMQ
jgi:hypothetical protein